MRTSETNQEKVPYLLRMITSLLAQWLKVVHYGAGWQYR